MFSLRIQLLYELGEISGENIFIDGILRITNANLDELEDAFNEIKKICEDNNVALEITVSATKEQLPKYMLEYIA